MVGTVTASCQAACQAQVEATCGALVDDEATACASDILDAYRQADPRQVSGTSNAAGAVLCQKPNGLVILRDIDPGGAGLGKRLLAPSASLERLALPPGAAWSRRGREIRSPRHLPAWPARPGRLALLAREASRVKRDPTGGNRRDGNNRIDGTTRRGYRRARDRAERLRRQWRASRCRGCCSTPWPCVHLGSRPLVVVCK